MPLTASQLFSVFDRLRPTNVDVTPSPDMSSIAAIRAGWRWPIDCPTDEELSAAWDEIQAELAAVQYRIDRVSGTPPVYAPISDQLDMLYHDQIDGTTTWKDHIKAVKAAHPKPS
ncbi:MAG: hypothetical protein PHV34_05870 [Verrucomicrobiae bacterium]|nr:hypothetical protein [Verrucomicrobiae bacterium]